MIGKSILIVDDEMPMRTALERLLTSQGFSTYAAPSAPLARRIAEQKQPDLILLDIYLGRGVSADKMDGVELCRALKQLPRARHIPIIILTSLGTRDHVRHSMQAGADGFIVKPFAAAKLLEMIEQKIQEHQPEPAATERLQRARVVVVSEEDETARAAASAALSAAGYSVHSVSGLARTLELATRVCPDVILAGIYQEKSRQDQVDGGVELCRKLKREPSLSRCKILVLAADPSGPHAQQALEAGACGVVLKPIRPDDVVRQVGECRPVAAPPAPAEAPAPKPAAIAVASDDIRRSRRGSGLASRLAAVESDHG